MLECRIKDLTIHYVTSGDQDGIPLVALHGLPLDHRHISNDLEPIFQGRRGWRRIYPDLPGMGRTGAMVGITHQDQVLDLILAFMDAVAPSKRFVVAGTSYGGYLARGMVHRRGAQIDGLLLNVAAVEIDKQKRNLPQHQVLREDSEFLAALQSDEQDMRDLVVMQSMELLETFRAFLSPAVAGADHTFLAQLRANSRFSFDEELLTETFPAPTLLLAGRFDHLVGYRDALRILDNYPRGTFALLDCAGHALAIEQKSLFQALVGEWLDRVDAYVSIRALEHEG